ncbi:lipoprotein YcdR [Escherichia coli]|nr:lipoprotein YcdR [Escherichia coli]
MTEYLRTKAKVNPHVFVWPYGEANGIAIEELKKLGYDMFFTLCKFTEILQLPPDK